MVCFYVSSSKYFLYSFFDLASKVKPFPSYLPLPAVTTTLPNELNSSPMVPLTVIP